MRKLKQIPIKIGARVARARGKQVMLETASDISQVKPSFYLPEIVTNCPAGEIYKPARGKLNEIEFIAAKDLKATYEFYPPDGEMHMWSGPGRESAFSIDASDKTDLIVCICVNSRPDRKRGLGLFVKVNNVYVDHVTKLDDGAQFIWFKIKKISIKGSARISIIVDTTYNPRDFIPDSIDQRQVGFSIRSVWVWPV